MYKVLLDNRFIYLGVVIYIYIYIYIYFVWRVKKDTIVELLTQNEIYYKFWFNYLWHKFSVLKQPSSDVSQFKLNKVRKTQYI